MQAGIQYLMRRWRAIPEDLQTRFLHAELLILPTDTQAGINDLLLVQSREAGINAAYRKRWHRLCGMAALCALAALLLFVYNAL